MRAVRVEELPCQRRAPIAVRERYCLRFEQEADERRFLERASVFLNSSVWMAAKRTKKGEPGEIDVRPLVLGISPAAEGRNIDFDWTGLYVSPVFVLQSVDSEFSLLSASLTKTEQFFGSGESR